MIKITTTTMTVLVVFSIWKYRTRFMKSINKEQHQQQKGGQDITKATALPTLFTGSLFSSTFERWYLFISVLHAILYYSLDISRAITGDPFRFTETLVISQIMLHCVCFLILDRILPILPISSSPDVDSIDNNKMPSSYLIYLCLITTLPINTLYQVMFLLLNKMGPSIAWITDSFIMVIIAYQFYMVEFLGTFVVIVSLYVD
ncbi:hypothetical protein BDA99DRAFT_533742 [Phascolomyces articulosus]|uniref:Uncharacterized protein n=1 Tax=Phascolomyces articulosus TaxID=60185 RepID=A0AAD5KIL0_9FUNG|nr:hypothetical protein BDA99DRAFT_533742 [Phascolomyces articulosus]